MPAAAVIPAPQAYTNAAAVKKLVVGSVGRASRSLPACRECPCLLPGEGARTSLCERPIRGFYFEKIRVFKAGYRLEYLSME